MPLHGMCCLRREFAGRLTDLTMKRLMWETLEIFYFDTISAEDVILFLMKQKYK